MQDQPSNVGELLTKIAAALAETPAQALGRVKAAAIRGLKSIAARKVDGDYVVFLPHILAEADRIESEAANASQ